MQELVCAICGTNKYTKTLFPANFINKSLTSKTFSARRLPDRIHYRFLRCQKCGLIFSSPILPPEKITKLYTASTFTYTQEALFLAETYGSFLEKILPQNNRNKLRLLDIGCGNGFFLEKAKALGIEHVFGIEPGKASVKKARSDIRKHIKIDILRSGLFKNNYFDIICCFHTFDHVVDPNTFLQTVYKLLKKGGHIIFVTHDTTGLSVKIFGEKSPIFDIEHIYLFNKQTLPRIFKKNRFIKTHLFTVKNTYPVSYWFHLVPLPKFLKNTLMKIFSKTPFFSLPISLSAGNIAIIAEK